jgi:hypothetical protein
MTDGPRVPSRQPPGWYVDPQGRNPRGNMPADGWRPGPESDGQEYGPQQRIAPDRRRLPAAGRLSPPAAPTRAENWESVRPARAVAADEPPDDTWARDTRARLALSALFGLSLLILIAAYALRLGELQVGALGGALFFGVGAAPLQLSERVPLDVRLGLAGLVALSVPLLVGSVMALLPAWYPLAAAALVGAATVALHAVACQRLLAGPARRADLRPVRAGSGSLLDVSTACTAVGTVAWLTGMFMTGHVVPGVLGFVPKVPVYWYAGIALLLAGIVLSRGKDELRAAFGLLSLLAALTVTPAVLYGMPRSQSAAKHIDLVQVVLQAHFLDRGAGIYQAYSGFFSGVAWLCSLTGYHSVADVTAIATYWPFVIELLILAGLRFFFGRLVSSWYRIYLAMTAVVLVNAIGADYFSPQSAGFALGLGVFALAVSRDIAGIGERTRISLLILAGCALAVTHELSPYIVGGVLVVLVVFRIIRPWWVPLTILAPAAVWAALNKSVLSGFIALSDLGDLSNFKPPHTTSTTGLQRLPIVGESSDALALGLLVLIIIACVALIRNWRSRATWAFMCCPGVGLVLIAANPYGNEGIFRAALFAIPWLMAVGLQTLPVSPSRLTAVLSGAIGALLVGTYLVAMFGLDDSDVIRWPDFRAMLYYQSTAAPQSYLIALSYGDLPTSVDFPPGANHYNAWDVVAKPALVETTAPTASDANALATEYYDYAKNNDGETGQLYAMWSPASVAYSVDYGLETLAQAKAWRSRLIASPDWKVVYSSDGTYLFRVTPHVLEPAKKTAKSSASKTLKKATKKATKTATG